MTITETRYTIYRLADPFAGIPGNTPMLPDGLDLRDHTTHSELVEGCQDCDDYGVFDPDCTCIDGRCQCTSDSVDVEDL